MVLISQLEMASPSAKIPYLYLIHVTQSRFKPLPVLLARKTKKKR